MTQHEQAAEKKVNCPFCVGEGCCFCDHSGRVSIGRNGDFFKTEQAMNDSLGVKYLKDMDQKANGGMEPWPEMIEHFFDDKNVPKWYKNQKL